MAKKVRADSLPKSVAHVPRPSGRPSAKSKCGLNESAALAPLRKTPSSATEARRFAVAGKGRKGMKSSALDLVEDTIQHGKVVPVAGGYGKGSACATKGGAPRRGQIDLTFPPKKSGLPSGPTLRFCVNDQGGFGPTIRVKTAAEAKRIAVKYQECAADPGMKLAECVRIATGQSAESLPFGGSRARRKRPMKTVKFLFPWQRRS